MFPVKQEVASDKDNSGELLLDEDGKHQSGLTLICCCVMSPSWMVSSVPVCVTYWGCRHLNKLQLVVFFVFAKDKEYMPVSIVVCQHVLLHFVIK